MERVLMKRALMEQAKDMHICEWNNKVLGKSAIKKGVIFQEADPLSTVFQLPPDLGEPVSRTLALACSQLTSYQI